MNQQRKIETGIRQFPKSKKKRPNYLFEAGATLASASGALGAAILLWQLYEWTQTSSWPTVRLFDCLAFAGINLEAIYYPANASGLTDTCQFLLAMPAAVMIPILGFLLFAILSLFSRGHR